MKNAKLVHNPTAGEGEHRKKELIDKLERAGYTCSYSSTKEKGWEKIKDKTDLLIVAGGDGTVRKSVAELLSRRVIDKKFPVGLLPYGTANNIAKTLELPEDIDEIICSWENVTTKPFDVGKIHNLSGGEFFLESFGFGVFPELIEVMRKLDHPNETPQEELHTALEELEKIVDSYPALHTRIILDEVVHEGNFLLCEVMNTRSLGPNLVLAPEADPGDGDFEIVLIASDQRKALNEYVRGKLDGKEIKTSFPVMRAKQIVIVSDATKFHADDELIEEKKEREIKLELYPSAIEFLV